MNRPGNITQYDELDLKLGIKSSLPHVKSTLALATLFWECSDEKSELIYSEQSNNAIVITNELSQRVVDKLSEICASEQIDPANLISTINDNPLFKSQMEALIVVFELVWKLAKVNFVEENKPASSERTGGMRYPKKLEYSINADIIHSVIDSNSDSYLRILMSWIGFNMNVDNDLENHLFHLFAALSEGAVFKLADGDKDIIFNQDSLYIKLIETQDAIDINGDKEAKGSLRILKSLLSDGLNPYLEYSNGSVTAKDGKMDELTAYRSRVETFLRLSATKIINSEDKDVKLESTENNPDDQKLEFKTGLESKFCRNRILFGAPGTGKSYTLNKERKELIGEYNDTDYERVTFHPDYSYANFVGTYKPVMVKTENWVAKSTGKEDVLAVLLDESKTAQEKYDLLYDKFKDGDLTRLPLLLGLYSDDSFTTRKKDGTTTIGDNSVERNHGKAIRPYVNLINENVSNSKIAYEYVPGPFMRVYIEALKNARTNNPRPFLLIVEEINRANVAAVFGDIFQLLDRDDDEVSEYPIQASEDIKKYLAKELSGEPEQYSKIKIPDNMFIWATMNSADQGVFPMDTAFKRRWDFTYLGIDDREKDLIGKTVVLGEGQTKHQVEWNKLRKAINKFLARNKINEDKQLGPYFISKKIVVPPNGNEIEPEAFISTFKHKVIMYLFEDAAKQKRSTLFEGCFDGSSRYSEICKEFDVKGIGIFNSEIQNATEPVDLLNTVEESSEEENDE